MKLLIFYQELADYFLSCVSAFREKYEAEVLIIAAPINQVAPFEFESEEGIKVVYKDTISDSERQQLAKDFAPDLVFVGGWKDKLDQQITNDFHKNGVKTLIAFDNAWNASFKQQLGRIYGSFVLKKIYDYCFVPGKLQLEFAEKLGFQKEQILQGVYAADYNLFNQLYLDTKEEKQKQLPKRFLYVGRYAEEKGINDLWNAFIDLKKEEDNEWELWCLGIGDVPPVEHPAIQHFGFVQPKDIARFVKETSVFVLPSYFEPWGVVVHEFAAAGFPLLCSDQVNAAGAFLVDEKNGYSFSARNKGELKNALRKIMQASDEQLLEMSTASNQQAATITPEKWADTLMNVLQ